MFSGRDKCILDTCCSSSKIYFLCTGKDRVKSAIILVVPSIGCIKLCHLYFNLPVPLREFSQAAALHDEFDL